MIDHFWFGKSLPTEFQDSIVREHLSFNGQLHFRCHACEEIVWADDVTFGKALIESGYDFPCPNCRRQKLDVVRFFAIDSRPCRRCGSHSFARPEDPFSCSVCHGDRFALATTLIHPPYPARLFVLISRQPLGQSPKDDVKFVTSYVSGLRTSPGRQFHQTCIHFIAFIASIFEHVYRSSPEAVDLLNVASGIMRTVYRETGNPDAAYLSIAIMIEGREATTDPLHRAVFGHNIGKAVYSALAQGDDELLSLRFGFDLKDYGVELSRQTLAAFEAEAIDKAWLGEVRARQKWLLGDMLQAWSPSSVPSEPEIEEALQWLKAAPEDPALPPGYDNYIRARACLPRRRSVAV